MKKNHIKELTIVLGLLLVLSLPFWLFDLDFIISCLFYSSKGGFIYKDSFPWKFLYEYAPLPSFIILIGSVLYLIIGFFNLKYFKKFRWEAIYLTLVMLIGPGLIVNAALKDHWGRPRPRQIEEFGGKHEYLKLWEKGKAGEGKSFPSGHASVGFYFFAIYFLLRSRNSRWTALSFWIALGFGTLVGLTRIVQGGHFASDVIWSAGLLYLTSFGFYWALSLEKRNNTDKAISNEQ